MKVILIQDVPGLGKIDDIKDVSEGYGRNFLFAKNLAVPATDKAMQDARSRHNRIVKDREQELSQYQHAAERLEGFELVLREKAGPGGVLYAAVSTQKIADMLKKAGFKVDKSQVVVKALKEAGEYGAKVKFPHGLEARIHIVISTN